MANESKLELLFLEQLQRLMALGQISEKYGRIIHQFFACFKRAVEEAELPLESVTTSFLLFLELIAEQVRKPYIFQPYHQKIRHPIDYYQFALDFIRPLVDSKKSKALGLENVDRMKQQIESGENVILFANHQTETDPQAISILLEKTHPTVAEKIIYVAGERVVTDPLAIPFSMGCDLLCIYSKRYIDFPPEKKAEKQLHNKATMELMSRLLQEGGKIIYVAPSGGRDRKGPHGMVEIAPLDPQSIEMFYLMARKAKTPTHFYPLTLATYDILPPPEMIQRELGEERAAKFTPIFLQFSEEFEMESYEGSDAPDKNERRSRRAMALWNKINETYQSLKRLI